MKKLIYGTLFLAAVGIGFVGCKKVSVEEENSFDDVVFEPSPNKFYSSSKEILITADDGTKGIMTVYSDAPESLALYTDENFVLFDIKENEKLHDAIKRHNLVTDEGEDEIIDDEETAEFDGDIKTEYAFQLTALEKQTDKKYAVAFLHPDSQARAKWKYYTHYSAALQNLEQSIDVTRNSVWRRVYIGLRYKYNASAGWSTIQNQWRKLSNNESASFTRNPCYQFRLRVKTKKSSAYSITFDD